MTEVSTPLPIRSPSGLIIQAGGQSSTEDKLSSHRRRETGWMANRLRVAMQSAEA